MFARCGLRDGKTRRGVSDDDLGTDGERAAARRIDRAVDSLTRAMSSGTFCVAAEASAGTSSGSSASSDEDAFSMGDGASDGDGAERRRESERGTSGSARGRMLWEDEWPSVESVSLINRAIFQAPPKSYDDQSHPWSPAHCVRLRSGAGYDFPCVWVPCRRTKAERVIIHCHANACDVGHIHTLCARDAECWRANVLLVEYPGYGTSEGVAYEASVDRHVAAAYVYVSEECNVNPSDIWVLGRSLGTGPATKLAAAVESLYGSRLGGVILHSPFTSVKEAGLALLGQIAHIMTDTAVAKALSTRFVCAAKSGGKPPTIESSQYKLFTTSLSQRVCKDALDIQGHEGAIMEGQNDAPLRGRFEGAYRATMNETVGGGSSEIQKNIIARRHLGLPKNF